MLYDPEMDLAERIRYARRAAGLSQDRLADACGGISREAVSQWENAATSPGLERVERIATATGVSYSWLATGVGPMRQEEEGGVSVFSKKALSIAERFDRLPPSQQTALESLIDSMASQAKPAPQSILLEPPKPIDQKPRR